MKLEGERGLRRQVQKRPDCWYQGRPRPSTGKVPRTKKQTSGERRDEVLKREFVKE
jgi:hypothetical protein